MSRIKDHYFEQWERELQNEIGKPAPVTQAINGDTTWHLSQKIAAAETLSEYPQGLTLAAATALSTLGRS